MNQQFIDRINELSDVLCLLVLCNLSTRQSANLMTMGFVVGWQVMKYLASQSNMNRLSINT